MFCFPRVTRLPHRLTAALSAALVLVLNLLAVWPDGHAWLHGHRVPPECACPHADAMADSPSGEEAESDHGCIVSLFAQGTTACFGGLGLAPSPATHASAMGAPPTAPAAKAPRFLRPPGCGPPVA
jgi:hypothetical protein